MLSLRQCKIIGQKDLQKLPISCGGVSKKSQIENLHSVRALLECIQEAN